MQKPECRDRRRQRGIACNSRQAGAIDDTTPSTRSESTRAGTKTKKPTHDNFFTLNAPTTKHQPLKPLEHKRRETSPTRHQAKVKPTRRRSTPPGKHRRNKKHGKNRSRAEEPIYGNTRRQILEGRRRSKRKTKNGHLSNPKRRQTDLSLPSKPRRSSSRRRHPPPTNPHEQAIRSEKTAEKPEATHISAWRSEQSRVQREKRGIREGGLPPAPASRTPELNGDR